MYSQHIGRMQWSELKKKCMGRNVLSLEIQHNFMNRQRAVNQTIKRAQPRKLWEKLTFCLSFGESGSQGRKPNY